MNHPIIKFVLENPWVLTIFAIFIMLEVILKYISLWRSARNDQLAWFVVLCIFNTLGILPLIYLIWFGKKKATGTTTV
jgi:hypothetical protein